MKNTPTNAVWVELKKQENHICQCGCNSTIIIKEHHRRHGIPKFISGHNSTGAVFTKERRKKISDAQKRVWANEEYKIKAQTYLREMSFASRSKHISEWNKKMWQDASYRQKVTQSASQRLAERVMASGGINPYIKRHKKGFHYSHKNSKELYYASSYELRAFEILDNDDEVIAYDRCVFFIPYELDGVQRRYIPDIIVHLFNGETEVIEVKPEKRCLEMMNMAKFDAAELFCNQRRYSFGIWHEADLGIGR